MFDVDALVADLLACLDDPEPRRTAKAVVERALASPGDIAETFDRRLGGITLLHHQPELTVTNIVWAPHQHLLPHNHRMWAVIGIYGGMEDNQFYRRNAAYELDELQGRRLEPGDVTILGTETIHAVTNPTDRLTGAIHVYGGDFVNQPRSQWGPDDLHERPFDSAGLDAQYERANRAAGLID